MIKPPLVSVIVSFFNAERFIEETIESVLAQSFDDWELLLVDDGSTDLSSDTAQRYAAEHPEKVSYATHPGRRNRGVCASRNLALGMARGAFVAVLDSDDVWLPVKLEEQVAILGRDPQLGMVFGSPRYWREWDVHGASAGSDFTPALGIETDAVHEPPSLLRRCYPLGEAMAPCPSDLLLRKDVLIAVGGFEEEFTGIYQMYEDQAFLAKVYMSTPVFASASTWTKYRLHKDSCCYRVQASGNERKVKLYYLNWLTNYLAACKFEDAGIKKSLGRAMVFTRYPLIKKLADLPGKLKRIVRRAG